MARNAKKRSKPLKLSKLGKSASPVAIKIPAPQLEDFDEFPALSDALSSKRKLSPDSSLFKVTQKEALAEEGVCVDGTTYYIQATAALCGISEAITPIALAPTFTENETAARRQFPGKAYTLYEENVEYPTVFLPKNLRQAVYDHLEEYRSYLFLPDQASWTVCDNFQIYGSMEKQSGLVQGKKDLVYISRHTGNGDFVVLRRLMNFVLRNQRAVSIASKWRSINHPNVVRMRSVTTTRAFNDSSVLFAYDFYPNAMTLECFMNSETRLLDEETIWSFITQLVSGLHAIHQAGLAARTLGEKRVLLTGLDSCTVKINCVAMPDVIEIADVPHSTYAKCFVGEHRAKYEDQQADFVALGSLVQHMIRNCSGDVSNDLTQLGKALAEGTINTMQMVLGGLGTRVFEYMALYQKQKGVLEVELSKEVENGRLFRLLYGLLEKIGRYDELFPGTENTHLLRMFKNYILSRGDVYEVISCLNKLDAGVREKVRLESYAESIVKFVTYEELRRVLEEDQPVISPFFYHLNVFNDSGLMG